MITKKGPFMSKEELHEIDMKRKIHRMKVFNGKEFEATDDGKNRKISDYC